MIPQAKKNIHEAEYHYKSMINSKNVEELEINFAAFVNSARNATWVLIKEFKHDSKFTSWYGDSKHVLEGSKIYEMNNDELCRFFNQLRREIVHEGINRLNFSTTIFSLNSATDMIDQPLNSSMQISGRGIYYLVNKGTPQEDIIPASTKAKMTTHVFIENAPTKHLNINITENNVINLSKIYLRYLKNIVEEWTGIINKCK